MNKTELIKNYYDCYANHDRESLVNLLVKTVKFTSSYATHDDRDKMLDEIWPHVIQSTKKICDLEIFGQGDEFMVKYRLTGDGDAQMCEFIRFEGDLIAEIELYMGTSTMQPPE